VAEPAKMGKPISDFKCSIRCSSTHSGAARIAEVSGGVHLTPQRSLSILTGGRPTRYLPVGITMMFPVQYRSKGPRHGLGCDCPYQGFKLGNLGRSGEQSTAWRRAVRAS
jgi:hypothetical protein